MESKGGFRSQDEKKKQVPIEAEKSILLESSMLQQVYTMLQQTAKNQQDLWEFLYCKHRWEIRNLKINNWKYEVPIPLFPKHILKEEELSTDNIPSYSTTKSQDIPLATTASGAKKKMKPQPPQKQQKQQQHDEEMEDSSSSTDKWMGTPPSQKAKDQTATKKSMKNTSSLAPSPAKNEKKDDKLVSPADQSPSTLQKKREVDSVATMAEEGS